MYPGDQILLTLSPISGLRVEIIRIQPFRFIHASYELPDVVDLVPVERVPGDVAQV